MAQTIGLGRTKRSLVFNVARRPPELIPPAGPTPYEFKELSDIDDQESLRFHLPLILFYRNNRNSGGSSFIGQDPAKVVKEAVAKALVPYYPFAGRLRERAGRKLVVECNSKGIMFIEADADVTLEDFGEDLHPPFPCLEELLFDVPGSTDILDTPLILIQVTRLICGGFILALRVNHTMTDAQGIIQFINALAELARGAESPSVQPVWERNFLSARNPPQVTCEHREYDEEADTKGTIILEEDMVQKSFFFGPNEIAVLRRFIPNHLKPTSTFEILAACIWRCRTIALQPDPEEIVRFMPIINARGQMNPPLPSGYYGNVLAFPAALSTAEKLMGNPISYALDLVKKAKAMLTKEYMMSLADFMVLKCRPNITMARTFVISNLTQAKTDHLDFGWGSPAYGGPARGGIGEKLEFFSFYIPHKNTEGEMGILVPLCLPKNAMEVFEEELNGLLCDVSKHSIVPSGSSRFISSRL